MHSHCSEQRPLPHRCSHVLAISIIIRVDWVSIPGKVSLSWSSDMVAEADAWNRFSKIFSYDNILPSCPWRDGRVGLIPAQAERLLFTEGFGEVIRPNMKREHNHRKSHNTNKNECQYQLPYTYVSPKEMAAVSTGHRTLSRGSPETSVAPELAWSVVSPGKNHGQLYDTRRYSGQASQSKD